MEPAAPLSDELVAEAYDHLKSLAARMRRRDPQASVHPTSLVHDVYERLARNPNLVVRDRAHLVAIGARAMRHVLADRARRRRATKRGGGWHQVSLEGIGASTSMVDLIALDQALSELAEMDPAAGRVVELRLLGGLKEPEIAGLVGTSERTVRRKWRAARAWLQTQLEDGP